MSISQALRRLTIMGVVALFGLWAAPSPSSSQETPQSRALVAAGYTRTLLLIDPSAPPEIVKYQCGIFIDGNGVSWPRFCGRYPFNPAGTGLDERYGIPSRWVKGDTVLERGVGGLDECQLEFIGLPRDYVKTGFDKSDSSKVTKNGTSAAFDSLPRCSNTTPPVVCMAPMVCIAPPVPCQVCETCEVCPSPPPPPPACERPSAFVQKTLLAMTGWRGIFTPGRIRALAAVQAWYKTCPQ